MSDEPDELEEDEECHPPAPPADWYSLTLVTAQRNFTVEGLLFERGKAYSASDPLVQEVMSETGHEYLRPKSG